MKDLKNNILLCLLVLFPLVIQAQDYASDFKKVRETWKQTKALSVDVRYNIYKGHYGKEVHESHKGEFKRNGDDYEYMKVYGIETVRNGNITVVKNDDEKFLFVSKIESAPQPSLSDEDIEKLLKTATKISYLGKQKGNKVYAASFKSSEFESIQLHINDKTWIVEKQVFYYRAKMAFNPEKPNEKSHQPRMEVIFTNINTNPGLTAADFSLKKYIQQDKGKWKPTSAYTSYDFIDQTQ